MTRNKGDTVNPMARSTRSRSPSPLAWPGRNEAGGTGDGVHGGRNASGGDGRGGTGNADAGEVGGEAAGINPISPADKLRARWGINPSSNTMLNSTSTLKKKGQRLSTQVCKPRSTQTPSKLNSRDQSHPRAG